MEFLGTTCTCRPDNERRAPYFGRFHFFVRLDLEELQFFGAKKTQHLSLPGRQGPIEHVCKESGSPKNRRVHLELSAENLCNWRTCLVLRSIYF